MGCFFACFRTKDSSLNPANSTEPVVSSSKSALSSLFQCHDEPIGNVKEGKTNVLPQELDIKEHTEEAKFLKACGTSPETPVQIRKALDKWESKSNSVVDSPSSCITDGLNPRHDMKNVSTPIDMHDCESHSKSSTVSQQVVIPNVKCKTKSVRFECDSESFTYSSKGSSEFPNKPCKQVGSAINRSVPKSSLSPSPLTLSNELQTPGTEFPEFCEEGKFTKARPQYVHLISNQAKGPSMFKDGYSDSNDEKKMLNNLQKEDGVMSTTVAESEVKQITVGKETKIEASLSDWLKPVSDNKGGKGYSRKSLGDRPILGMVAAHWNEDETSQVPPKWWDGNGIPNSTNKYKEDQKVSWHATPFEERLEKALSEETFISKREAIGAFDLNEAERSDTAFSHMKSSECILINS